VSKVACLRPVASSALYILLYGRNIKKLKLKVARRGLYSTAALCIADSALAPNGVPSFISRGATAPSGVGALN
jgi:hypothetical protein